MNRLASFFNQRRRWRAGLLATTSLVLPALALAQTPDPASTPIEADTTAAPVVAPSTSAAGGLPSSEFETYNVSGRGLRYTAVLTGIYRTGTVERIYFTTSHTANLTVGFTYATGK